MKRKFCLALVGTIVFLPKQNVAFLGIALDSVKKQTLLTQNYIQNMLKCLQYISQHASKVKSHDIQRTLGYMVSSFPAIPSSAAYYGWLGQYRSKALKNSRHLLHQAPLILTLNVKVLKLHGLKYKIKTPNISLSVVYTDIQDIK